MFSTLLFILLTSNCIFPVVFGISVARSVPRSMEEEHVYTVYAGNGSPDAGWPSKSSWKSFEALWTANQELINVSCKQYKQEENSDSETSIIYEALKRTASSSALPAEFLLAIMMQESRGCVRAPTTHYYNENPGLFQSFNGPSSCNPNGTGVIPCPNSTISGMIDEGAGIGLQFGLTQAINRSQATDVSQYYKAARIYNSGSLDSSGNLGLGVATHCYASDIANRLQGWNTETEDCDEATIGSLGNTSNTKSTEMYTYTSFASSTGIQINTISTANPDAPEAPGAASSCKSWYLVRAGDTCFSTGISLDELRALNSNLNEDCTNLMTGYAYCTAD